VFSSRKGTAGDLLLTVLADRFRALLRPMDTVARYGGDEFTFLFEGLENEAEAAVIAERISRSAGLPLPPPLGDRGLDLRPLGHQSRRRRASIGQAPIQGLAPSSRATASVTASAWRTVR
jgi:GGDEF domain-containing protein